MEENKKESLVDAEMSQSQAKKRPSRRLLRFLVFSLVIWLVAAYFLIPIVWRRHYHRHPALDDTPHVTHTANGIAGDPLNVGLVGSKEELVTAMLGSKWYPADPLTLKSCVRIAADTVLRRSYDDAPVSNLFLWGRKEDLAFEQPVGDSPKQRHHVRFWRSEKTDENGSPLWIGAATYDETVGLSHTTAQITHHIAPNIDAERDRLIEDLNKFGFLTGFYWVDGFHDKLEGRNGGGDPYFTDGRLEVGVLRVITDSK
jgi:hypothetical protein